MADKLLLLFPQMIFVPTPTRVNIIALAVTRGGDWVYPRPGPCELWPIDLALAFLWSRDPLSVYPYYL